MARAVSWDILLGEYPKDEIEIVQDRITGYNKDDMIRKTMVIDWKGRGLYAFDYTVDYSGRLISSDSLYEVRKNQLIVWVYNKVEEKEKIG